MGWLWVHKEANEKPIDILQQDFYCHKDEIEAKIIDYSIKGNTIYLARQLSNEKTGHKEVYAIVCLCSINNKEYFNFGYKDMEESMIPCTYDCPKRILNLLTPTDNEFANEWRKKCLEYQVQKKQKVTPKHGDTIKFNVPIEFNNGDICDKFVLLKYNNKTYFGTHGQYYRISNWKRRDYEVIQA